VAAAVNKQLVFTVRVITARVINSYLLLNPLNKMLKSEIITQKPLKTPPNTTSKHHNVNHRKVT